MTSPIASHRLLNAGKNTVPTEVAGISAFLKTRNIEETLEKHPRSTHGHTVFPKVMPNDPAAIRFICQIGMSELVFQGILNNIEVVAQIATNEYAIRIQNGNDDRQVQQKLFYELA